MLSQQEIDEYNENGYILARNVVSKEQLTELQRLTYEFIENSKDVNESNNIVASIYNCDIWNNKII